MTKKKILLRKTEITTIFNKKNINFCPTNISDIKFWLHCKFILIYNTAIIFNKTVSDLSDISRRVSHMGHYRCVFSFQSDEY